MAGFTDSEREQIRDRLIESGKEQVIRYGPAKTRIGDITEPVGIATSTFYLFFDSKDEFFLELIQQEMDSFQEQLSNDLNDVQDPYEGLIHLFESYVDFADGNPLVQQVIIQNNYREVFQSRVPEALDEYKRERIGQFHLVIEELQELDDGDFGELPPHMVIGVMSTLGLFALHKDEYENYEEGYGDQLQSLLIKVIANGLTSNNLT